MNTNCLTGIKCPQCSSEGPFIIEVTQQVLMHDEGAEDVQGVIHWDGDSYMRCDSCGYDNPAASFTEKEEHRKVILATQPD